MLRKHINSLPIANIEKEIPFYAWNCITLQLKNRDVSLVIRDETDMMMLLRVLVKSLRTVDCHSGTAEPIIKALIK